MQTSITRFICLAVALVAACLPALGAPSGLNVIPTADTLEKGEISLEAESVGTGFPWYDDCDSFILFQVGLGSGIELGVDRCWSESDTWVNAKWRAVDESGNRPAVALGVQGISGDEVAQPYAALLKTIGPTRVHAGLIAVNSKTRLMLGADHPLGSRAALQADYVSGDENSVTIGAALDVGGGFSLTIAQSVGNSDETEDGQIVNLAWSSAL